ncbi:MAG: MBG domain-containing protein, partial [Acidimicrobiales bacterium]
MALGVGISAMPAGATSYSYAVTATIAVGCGAGGVAVDSTTDTIYVTTCGNNGNNNMSVIDGSTNTVTATVPVGYGGRAIAVDTAFDTVYVANTGYYGGSNGSVSVIDAANDTVTATIPDPASPRAIAVDPNTNTIYVANYMGTLSVIHGGTVTDTINVEGYGALNGVAVDPITDTIYVSHYPDNAVSVISGSTGTVTSTIDLVHSFTPMGVAVDPATDTVYVATSGNAQYNTMSVIDGSTNTVTDTVNLGAVPLSLAADPTTNTIYVAQYNSNGSSVAAIDGSTDTVTTNVPIGGYGGGVAVDYATHLVYAAAGQSVSVIEQTPQGPPATTTTLSVTPNPATYGQPVTLTATVSPSDGAGTVSFFAGGSSDPITGCAQLALGLSGGTYEATCSTSTMSAGTQPVTAAYSGDADFQASSGSLSGGEVVDRAPLTVTAPSPTMAYGGSPPGLTPSYAGFVNGDNPGSLSASPTCSTTATTSSAVGSYPVNCSGASDPNYTVSYVAGTLTISKAPLTVTAPSPTMTYGGAVPALSPAYSGLVDGDTPASLSAQATCTTSASKSSPVGDYPVTCSGASDPNYA